MRITPLDIRKQEFRKGMRGLDSEEVYAFLATVAEEYESVLNDNKALRERLLELDDKVQEYRSMEKVLRDTLITAERVTVEAKDNARREANIIVKEAQMEAEKALVDIKNEAVKLNHNVRYLRTQRESYLARMKAVIDSHMKFLDAADKDFADEDDAIDTLASDTGKNADVTAPELKPGTNSGLFAQPKSEAPEPVRTPVPAPSADTVSAAPPTPAAMPTPTPVSPATRPAADQDPMSDIGAIIDRMRQGQHETLSSDVQTGTQVTEPPSAKNPVIEPRVPVTTSPEQPRVDGSAESTPDGNRS